MKRSLAIVLIPVAFAAGLAGCTQRPVNAEGQSTPGSTTGSPPAESDLFTDPAAHTGRTVRVEGTFQGYRTAECTFAPDARSIALTRSDWLVRRDSRCLYVTGDPPAGLDPIDPGAIGRRLELSARVIEGSDGKFLLELQQARAIQP